MTDKIEVSGSRTRCPYCHAEVVAADSAIVCRDLRGGGVARSNDGGVSWITSSSGLTAEATCLCADGDVWAATADGVFHSTNGGASFVRTPYVGNASAVISTRWGAVFAGREDSVYASTDGGASWHVVVNPFGLPIVEAVAFARDSDRIVTACPTGCGAVYSQDAFYGLVESDVGLTTTVTANDRVIYVASASSGWALLIGSTKPNVSISPPAGTLIIQLATISIGDGAFVWLLTDHGVYTSSDSAATWVPAGVGFDALAQIALDQQDPKTAYAIGPVMVYKTTTGGR